MEEVARVALSGNSYSASANMLDWISVGDGSAVADALKVNRLDALC